MKISTNSKIIALIILFLAITVTECQQFVPTWNTYRWIQSQKSLFQPYTQNFIQLSHPLAPYFYVSVQSQQNVRLKENCGNFSEYAVGGKQGKIRVIGQKQWISIYVENIKEISIQFKYLKQSCLEHKSYAENMVMQDKQLMENCKISQNKFVCHPNNTLIFTFSLPNPSIPAPNNKIQHLRDYCQQSTQNFMKSYSITNTDPLKLQIVKQSLSALLSSICLFKYQNSFYLGYCQQPSRTKKWVYNYKLAPFSIYLLADFDYQLAEYIYRDLFDLLTAKWMYPNQKDQLQVLPIPEHVEIFNRFGSNVLQMQKQVQLLNSFFVAPMLSQLGTLHEQLNYRQAKKFHPLLLKMLQQKWSSTSLLQSLKSLYQQSFTQDFKFHSYGQTLQQSATKCAWIYKTIDIYTSMLIKHHAFYMPMEQIKQHLQEHFTLLNIMKVYANDDSYSKTGKYKDIVNVGENLKIYGNYTGYQSILPYVYGLGKVYPIQSIKELETMYGLKSSNQEQHEQYQKKYRYRGDIHSYFNLKILTGLQYRLNEDKSISAAKRQQIQTNLNKTLTAIGNKVIKDYKQNKEIYTSWTIQGRGKEKIGWGKIVTALFLKWVV